MNHIHEAYDALIDKLKKQIEERDQKMDDVYCREAETISLLLDFIIEKHGRAIALGLAHAAEEKGGKHVVSFVKDKCHDLGLDE
jgi:hypothetical protein